MRGMQKNVVLCLSASVDGRLVGDQHARCLLDTGTYMEGIPIPETSPRDRNL
jgi:hypothetical protein